MIFLTEIKNYLWRPFEIHSVHKPEKIEKELSKRIIKEPTFHLMPYYDKLFGNVGNGRFAICYTPLSSVFMRGAGRIKIKGEIEKAGKGGRIYGFLPGPPFALWLLIGIWFVFMILILKNILIRHEPSRLISIPFVTLLFAIFTGFIFLFDRNANRKGEEKILAVLKEVAG